MPDSLLSPVVLTQKIAQARTQVGHTNTLADLEAARQEALGKEGWLTRAFKGMGALKDPSQKREVASLLNKAREDLQSAVAERRGTLETAELAARLQEEAVDGTLPAPGPAFGRLHPVTEGVQEIMGFFKKLGFTPAFGPEQENEYYNFSALNVPPHHPARAAQDTFYFSRALGTLLRTHTTSVQIRTLEKTSPPLRMVSGGRVYRRDDDATHTPMFHQVEGLMVDRDIHMGHLKGLLASFLQAFFGLRDVPLRFRPGYFPFTEPSAEVDILCDRSQSPVRIGEGNDWLEIDRKSVV